jgi:hypothetical protein
MASRILTNDELPRIKSEGMLFRIMLYAISSEAHVRGPMMPSGTSPWSR